MPDSERPKPRRIERRHHEVSSLEELRRVRELEADAADSNDQGGAAAEESR